MGIGSPRQICQLQDQKALLAQGNPRKIEIPTVLLLPFVFGQQPGEILADATRLPPGGEVGKSCSFFFNATAG